MITLKELAKELKVSVSTVSKALHDSPEISVQTIEKVKKLAKKRNYKPNKIALSLKSNRTLTIGVVIPDILNRFYSKVLDGIHDTADEHGYDVITVTTKESIIKEMDSLQILSSGNVDGVIIAMSEETLNKNDFSHIKEFTMKDTPIVMFDRVTDKINCDKVIIDDHIEIQKFIEKNKPDAIISADIICGVISINIARSLGIKIPEELSVVGFGDKTISEYSSPKLTTIYQHGSEIGNRSVELLVDRMNSKWFGLEKNTNSFTTEIIPTVTIGGGSK